MNPVMPFEEPQLKDLCFKKATAKLWYKYYPDLSHLETLSRCSVPSISTADMEKT